MILCMKWIGNFYQARGYPFFFESFKCLKILHRTSSTSFLKRLRKKRGSSMEGLLCSCSSGGGRVGCSVALREMSSWL